MVPESFETYQIVNPGDIIIRTTDLQNDHTSLRIGMVKNRGIITSAYLALRPKQGVSKDYAYQILNVWDQSKAIYEYGSGLRQNLDFPNFKRMPVAIPPPDEQAAIVRFLDHANRKIDGFIRAKRKLIGLLNEQKQAIIHSAVTRGLNPDVKLKDSGVPWLGEIPEHWGTVTVGASTTLIQTGPFGSQLHSNEYIRGGTPIINPSHMKEGSIVADMDVAVGEAKLRELARHRMLVGDIVVARRGELGRCGLVTQIEEGWLCGTGSLLVRTKRDVFNPGYFQELFSSSGVCDLLRLASVGSTMDNLNAGMVGRLRFPLPSVEEQTQILKFIGVERAKNKAAISTTEREIALMLEYRTRLTADIVTGKLDVREAAAKLPEVIADEVVEPPADEPIDEIETEEGET